MRSGAVLTSEPGSSAEGSRAAEVGVDAAKLKM